jgi:uncharacterized protein GlcG (DUF336 family)
MFFICSAPTNLSDIHIQRKALYFAVSSNLAFAVASLHLSWPGGRRVSTGRKQMSRGFSGLPAVVLAFVIVVAGARGAQAQGLVNMQKLSAPLANELVGESVAQCAQKGYTVTAVVVDLDGVRQALLRGNGAPIHTLDNAFYKAYSAASLTLARKEDSTKAVADRMSKSPPTTVPQTPLPNVTYAVGGVTIMAGGTAIGAIGVSGAPGGQFDEECARAALAKIQDRMK